MGTASTTRPPGSTSKRVKARKTGSVVAEKVATVTVGELRASFKAVEAKLTNGARVQVTRRGEVVAVLVAPALATTESSRSLQPFSDFLREREAWLRQTWGDQPVNIDTTALISEGRDRDFLS